MKTVITAAQLITPMEWIETPHVIVEDGQITALGPRDALPAPVGARELNFPGLILARVWGAFLVLTAFRLSQDAWKKARVVKAVPPS